MSSLQTTLPLNSKPFNGILFSSHYLERNLPKSSYWKKIDEDNENAFKKIKELYEKKVETLEKIDESQLEEEFIKPLLKELNHKIDVQPPLLSLEGL